MHLRRQVGEQGRCFDGVVVGRVSAQAGEEGPVGHQIDVGHRDSLGVGEAAVWLRGAAGHDLQTAQAGDVSEHHEPPGGILDDHAVLDCDEGERARVEDLRRQRCERCRRPAGEQRGDRTDLRVVRVEAGDEVLTLVGEVAVAVGVAWGIGDAVVVAVVVGRREREVDGARDLLDA